MRFSWKKAWAEPFFGTFLRANILSLPFSLEQNGTKGRSFYLRRKKPTVAIIGHSTASMALSLKKKYDFLESFSFLA